ncbi:lipase family alpha/beta hydrolase [Streptomyces olivoreticuli]|uniref:lipase family alpha/beta hydrolase n=1 Tax=Streptomyces olivoreticuli TaxID=68246 RepID=UPI000E21DCD3|nr:hypothetical protein [Streptomyces olivoreticuli]
MTSRKRIEPSSDVGALAAQSLPAQAVTHVTPSTPTEVKIYLCTGPGHCLADLDSEGRPTYSESGAEITARAKPDGSGDFGLTLPDGRVIHSALKPGVPVFSEIGDPASWMGFSVTDGKISYVFLEVREVSPSDSHWSVDVSSTGAAINAYTSPKGGIWEGFQKDHPEPPPPPPPPEKLPVVFVHGMNDDASAFDSMKQEFREAGWKDEDLFAWAYGEWKDSNFTNAQRFKQAVNAKFGTSRHFEIVAHSLGSIPTRLALVQDPEFRSRVRTWTSIGGPNRGAGQNYWKTMGLHIVCSSDGKATQFGKDNFPDYVSDSTCELELPLMGDSLMNTLNHTPNVGPTPGPTDYEEIISRSDGTIENDASELPGASNNHIWYVDGVSHGQLPRDAAVIAGVVRRIKGDLPQPPHNPLAVTGSDIRNVGEGVNLYSLWGTADTDAGEVEVHVGRAERTVVVNDGEWRVDFGSGGPRSLSGSFSGTVHELRRPQRTQPFKVS